VGALAGLLLVAISVGLSNFAAAIGIGMSGVDARTRIRVGLAFGLFEAAMPIIGLFLGEAVNGPLGTYGHYLGGALLVLTGLYTVWQGRVAPKGIHASAQGSSRTLILAALALSIDNLVVGFAIGVYRVNIVVAALLMGVVSVLMTLLGLELGGRLGTRFEQWSGEMGGGILILIGVGLGSGVVH